MIYSIPFGKNKIKFKVPDGFSIQFAAPKQTSSIIDVYKKTLEAISNPINSKPLEDLVQGKNSVCLVVTDITRECPDKELLIPILEVIEKHVKRENITILIASGMHKSMSYDEKVEKYGKIITDNYKIIDHDVKDNHIFLGTTKNGTPIKISQIAIKSDFLMSLGVVEPHQFAGYSGGYKTVSIGLAGDETISNTHSGKLLKKVETRVGKIDGNPIQDEIIEIGKKTGLNFIVNVILGPTHLVEIKAGEPFATHRSLIKKAREIYEVPVKNSYNVVLCGVGYPKDSNLYQVSRAASYLFFAHKPVINPGGYIIIPAMCTEGAGKGIGEQRFFSLLKNHTIDEILNFDEFKAGEQRAFFIASVLQKCKIIIVGCKTPNVIKDAKMIPAKDMDEAFAYVRSDFGENLEILFVPNAITTLPVIA
jgi:nickel-dependent lactate racemase